ncbi:MAG: AAA family ATPase [Acidobacteriota bacterium]
MRRVKQLSLDRLNLLLDIGDLQEGFGLESKSIEISNTDVRFPCPLHPPTDSEPRSVGIDRITRYGRCRHSRCSFGQGGSLLWLYSRAKRQDLLEVAEALAPRKKLHLEYEFWIGDTPGPRTDSFVHAEALVDGHRQVISVDEIGKVVERCPVGARVSPLRTEVRDPEQVRRRRQAGSLPLLGNLYAVMKAPVLRGPRGAEEGLELALADTRFVCRELMERYQVPEEALGIYFCSEGIHLEVDFRVFGALPDPTLARIYRRIVFLLGGVDEQAPARPLPGSGRGQPAHCPTLEQNAYTHDFLWQCEGSRAEQGGRYKIWVSLNELLEKDARDLHELAAGSRRPLDPLLRVSMERLARGLYIYALESESGSPPFEVRPMGEVLSGAAAPRVQKPAVAAEVLQGAGPGVAPPARALSARAASTKAPASGVVTAEATSGSAPRGVRTLASSSAPKARSARRAAAREPAPAHAAGAISSSAVRQPAAAPGPEAPAGSSAADLLARLLSRDQAPIPISAFGSKTHAGTGMNQVLQGGLHVGQVVGLAGATGEGKTTFALQLAGGVAFDNLQRERDNQPIVPVLYLCGQARPEALLLKNLARLGKLDAGEILQGRSKPRDFQEAMRIYQSFHRHLNMEIATPDPDLEQVHRAVEHLLRPGARAVLLVVDPLLSLAAYEVLPEGAGARMLRRLGALARELPVAVVVVIACPPAGRGGPLGYVEALAPLAEWTDVLLGLKTDLEIERAGGVMSLDERLNWKKELKVNLRRKAEEAPLKRGGIDYREVWKTEYSVLMTLKSRWQYPIHTAYYFHKALHRFEEI